METLLSVCLGLGLAAACGFRVFVPLLVTSLAHQAGYLSLTGSFEWIGSTPAMITFALATGLEIGAYYVPWLDNLLDSVATPASVVAGILVTAAVVTGMDPFLKWTLAVIAGGGAAGAMQLFTTGARGASTVLTAGLGNPLVSSLEAGSSLALSIVSVVFPILAIVLVIALILFVSRWRGRRRAPA